MSVRNLEYLFNPRFQGHACQPDHKAIEGVLAYPGVASMPIAPDLAVIAPPPPVPGLIAALAAVPSLSSSSRPASLPLHPHDETG